MKKTVDAKKWSLIAVLSILAILLMVAAFVAIIDPFLHYHAPLKGLEYPLNDERYINDGIAKHYDYEAIITGSSTSQNFKASQFDELFAVTTVKQTYASGTYYEVGNGLKRAFEYNPNVKYVLWGLDLTRINNEYDEVSYDGIPDYLYDKNPLNDAQYLFNFDVLRKCVSVLSYTRSGQKTTSMDDYGAWYPWATYGRESVLSGLGDFSDVTEEYLLDEEDYKRIAINISENIVLLAEENPDTEFYIFYTPSSAVFWYGMVQSKQLNAQLSAEKYATELMLSVPNIHLYGFADRSDITADLERYMDTLHYSPEISNEIMAYMHDGIGELTLENYEDYYIRVKRLYESEMEYDY